MTSIPISALDLLILVCATWRIAFYVARESGPFDSAKRIRERFPLGGLTTCVKCVSVWAALLCVLLWTWDVGRVVVLVLGVSGAALMIASYTGVQHSD